MKLNALAKLVLAQAKEKGWGHSKETMSMDHKVMLLATEITELDDALKKKTSKPKDDLRSELGDILMRALHLGIVWDVDFDKTVYTKSYLISKPGKFSRLDLLYLHNLVSKCYESMRKKRYKLFQRYLAKIAYEAIALGQCMNVDVVEAAMRKMEMSKTRVWDSTRYRGGKMGGMV